MKRIAVIIADQPFHSGRDSSTIKRARWSEATASFKMQPAKDMMQAALRNNPDIEFCVYRSDEPTWNPTIVEVGIRDKGPMLTLGMYKIIQGQFAN
jgi:hypothetical protein